MAKAKEEPEGNEEGDWSPDQPIPDEDGEMEAQRRHMLNRRLRFLDEEAEKKSKKSGKNSKGDKKPWLIGG